MALSDYKHFLSAVFFLIQFVLVTSVDVENWEEDTEVIFVNVIYRHGHRTPGPPYPKDPHQDPAIWPEGWLQLTNKGKKEQFELGQWLRDRYDHLLGEYYSSERIYVMSTDKDRAIMSAQLNMAGMYPPRGRQLWTDDLSWQPVPVHSQDPQYDHILSEPYCPKYELELQTMLASDDIAQLDNKYKHLKGYLNNKTGMEVKTFEDIDYLYDHIGSQVERNLTMPDWAQEILPEPWFSASMYYFVLPTFNDKLKRLKSGPLLKDIMSHLMLKSLDSLKPNRTMWVYSGHDYTISNILNTMGVFDWTMPPFSATILIELRRDRNNQHFVTILYKNGTEESHLLRVPGCESVCPLGQFHSLLSRYLPSDWETECQLPQQNSASMHNGLTLMLMISTTLMKYIF